MKPLIGLTPLYDSEHPNLWMRDTYQDILQQSGAIPVVLSFDSDPADVAAILRRLDGIVFTGGADVNPALYGQEKKPFCGENVERRDVLEKELFQQAYARDMPIMGICRGSQFINVMLGGTLYQDILTERPNSFDHRMRDHFDEISHWVEIQQDTPLFDVVGSATFPVNSIHHQGIRGLSPYLEPMALSTDGLVESFYAPAKRCVWGIQWHPEFAFKSEPRQREIVEAFVARCA